MWNKNSTLTMEADGRQSKIVQWIDSDSYEYFAAQMFYMDANLAIFPDGPRSKTTPLLYAIKENKIEFAKVLLNRGANVNLSFFRERPDANPAFSDVTPLIFAIENKCSLDVIQLLLSRHPDLDTLGSCGKSAFVLAIEYHMDLAAEAIMKKNIRSCVEFFCENIKTVELSGWSAIGFFREIGNFEIRDRIAQLSLIAGRYDILEVLIGDTFYTLNRVQSGVYYDKTSPNYSLNRGFTLLHFAVNYDVAPAVDYIMKRMKEMINKVDEFGASPFHYACSKDTTDVVEVLLSHGVDMTKRTGSGVTPLHIAASNPNSEVVFKKLFDLTPNISGEKEYSIADCKSSEFSQCALTGNYFEDSEPIVTAIRRNSSTAVGYLLAYGVQIDFQDMIRYCLRNSYGQTLAVLCAHLPVPTQLWSAAEKECFLEIDGKHVLYYLAGRFTPTLQDAVPLVEFCIRQLNCHPDGYASYDTENNSPLHLALMCGNIYIVEALVVHGADVNLKNLQSQTSLHLVADLVLFEKLTLDQGIEMTKFLLRNGAKSQLGENLSAFNYSLNYGLYELVSVMTEFDLNVWYAGSDYTTVPFLHQILAKLVNNPFPRYHRNSSPVTLETKVNLVRACVMRGLDINKRCYVEQSFPSHKKTLKWHYVIHIAFAFFDGPFCAALAQFRINIKVVTKDDECLLYLTLFEELGDGARGNIKEFTEKVNALKAIGVNVNEEVQFPGFLTKMDPYKLAIAKGNFAAAEVLLKCRGFSFEYDDVELAIETGNADLAEKIANKITEEIMEGTTKLSVMFSGKWNEAPSFGDRFISFLRNLVEQGYNINAVDHHGDSLLHYLSASQWPIDQEFSENIIGFIISVGGSPIIDSVNKCGQSPLHLAVARRTTLESLLTHSDSFLPYSSVQKFFADHSQYLVATLDAHGANFDQKTLRGWSAMHIAANSNICVTKVFEAGGESLLNFSRNRCRLPNHVLEEICNECIVSEVDSVELGFNSNRYQRISPLSIAIAKNNKKLIELLLTLGATVNPAEIHTCLMFGDSECAIHLFHSFPPELSLQDDVIDDIPALQLFFHAMCNPPNATRTIMRAYHGSKDDSAIALVENYIDRGYQLSFQTNLFTPILFSVIRCMFEEINFGTLSLINYLIEVNVPLNVQDTEGNSLLTYVLMSGRVSCEGQHGQSHLFKRIRRITLQMLIENFADTDLAHFRTYTYHSDDDDILRLFLKANIHLAAEWDHVTLCQHHPSHKQPFEAITTLINLKRKSPLSLLHLCRLAVRRIPDFADDIHDIGIPEIIQDFITFKEKGDRLVDTSDVFKSELLNLSQIHSS